MLSKEEMSPDYGNCARRGDYLLLRLQRQEYSFASILWGNQSKYDLLENEYVYQLKLNVLSFSSELRI